MKRGSGAFSRQSVDIAVGGFDVVIDNEKGQLITTFENLSVRSLDNLAKNYGWVPK